MDSNLSQLVNKPTHLNSEGVPVSLLDLAFTNVPDLFSPMVDVMHPIGLSDHCRWFCTLPLTIEPLFPWHSERQCVHQRPNGASSNRIVTE